MKVKVLHVMIKRDICVEVKGMTLYRAKSIAIDEIEGKHKEQCRKIRDYVFAILMINLGSRVVADVDPN